MSSLLAWLDTSPSEQKAAREIISYFSDQEGRDELGIGQIRDALGDRLFPGTSTLHTRARYFLFVPWCYLASNAQRHLGGGHKDIGRKNERKLIETLRTSDTQIDWGVIGGRAGPSVKTLSSAIYWNALVRYGIRTYSGEVGTLVDNDLEQTDELAARVMTEWDPGLPAVPAGFPRHVAGGMSLTYSEARWLRDRIITSDPDSLLAALLIAGDEISLESDFPWEQASREEFAELDHAFWFSNVMYGAALLYNLIVAEAYNRADPASNSDYLDHYQRALETWQKEFVGEHRQGLKEWDRRDLRAEVQSVNPGVSSLTWIFVDSWIDGVSGSPNVADDHKLRSLVEDRERRKGKQSRLINEKLLSRWSGASGATQLRFRWSTVRSLVNDILHGLQSQEEPVSDNAGT